MSWFAEIAGKAENLLNKIDHNAAMALNQAATDFLPPNAAHHPLPSAPHGNPDVSHYSSGNLSTVRVDTGGDDLNSVAAHYNTSVGNSHSPSRSPEGIQPRSNGSNQNGSASKEGKVSGRQNKLKVNSKSKSSQKPKTNANATVTEAPTTSTAGSSPSKKEDDSELIAFLNDSSRKELDQNLVLQNELANQAREVELLYKSNKQLQSDNEVLKSQVLRYEEGKSKEIQISEMETQVRQSENAQKNLKSLLKKKDDEIEKLKRSLDQSLEKLQQLEKLQATQNRLEVSEMEKNKLMQSNVELKDQITSLTNQLQVSDSHVSSVKGSLTLLETEFTNYKEKAKSILKQKDDLIASVQGLTGSLTEDDGSAADSETPFHSEINALKSERELLSAEISQCRATTESFREENHRLESELRMTRGLVLQFQKQLADEKEISGALQDENLQLKQQISCCQFELDMEKSESRKLAEWKSQRESEEINNERSSPTSSEKKYPYTSINADSEENLRMRITALTQSLLEKQSLINNLSSDKQLLQINVERLQDQMREISNEGSFNYAGFPQTVISNKPLYLSESPWDSGMSTGMKRAFSTVDSLCCQAGLALRRRPNLRLGFCIYILLLHFWVFFILCHSFNHVPHFSHPLNGPAPAPI